MRKIDNRTIVRENPVGVAFSVAELQRLDEVVAAEKARRTGRITRSSVIRALALRALTNPTL